eukprot:gene66292-90729_t
MRTALSRYFAGDLAQLDGITCHIPGTPFQNKVWTALRTIPAGTTLSYGTLAAQLGVPTAMRAVGHANGANPLSVVVPCHRLIGANGSLTGYGGGLERKRWLLMHEGVEVKIAALGHRPCAPSPLWGEGWGEGVRTLDGARPLTRIASQSDLSPAGRGNEHYRLDLNLKTRSLIASFRFSPDEQAFKCAVLPDAFSP